MQINLTGMPKMKTHSGAKKRFKVTGSGKIKRNAAYKRHLMRKKTKSQKRRLNKDTYINPADLSIARRLLCI